MELPVRKPNRLPSFDYNTPGAYFITICTKDRKNILGKVVGGGAFDAPQAELTDIGKITEKYILSGNCMPQVCVDKYVVMPNHIHMILFVNADSSGTPRASSPTNAIVPHFVSTFKRFCYREAGSTIFQRSYHDHIIRNQKDYLKIWEYIDNNPAQWQEDCFYQE
jgi:REP element-mobilizing transposase RayT